MDHMFDCYLNNQNKSALIAVNFKEIIHAKTKCLIKSTISLRFFNLFANIKQLCLEASYGNNPKDSVANNELISVPERIQRIT